MVLNPLNFIFLKSITPVLVVRHGFPDLKKNMSFSLENCNSALNPDLALRKKPKRDLMSPRFETLLLLHSSSFWCKPNSVFSLVWA